MKNLRVRRSAILDAADPTWAADNATPMDILTTLGGTTDDGVYGVDIVPEDGSATISFEFDRQDSETDGDIGDELELAGAALLATTLEPYLTDVMSDGAGVLTLSYRPNSSPFRVELRAPGTGTFTPDHDDSYPIVARGNGKGQLFIEFAQVSTTGVPLAPGSTTVDVSILSIVDRSHPRGRGGAATDTPVAVTTTDETSAHPIGAPLIVDCPPGLFVVSFTGAPASVDGSTTHIEAYVSSVEP